MLVRRSHLHPEARALSADKDIVVVDQAIALQLKIESEPCVLVLEAQRLLLEEALLVGIAAGAFGDAHLHLADVKVVGSHKIAVLVHQQAIVVLAPIRLVVVVLSVFCCGSDYTFAFAAAEPEASMVVERAVVAIVERHWHQAAPSLFDENGRKRADAAESGIAIGDVKAGGPYQGVGGIGVSGRQRQQACLFQHLVAHHTQQGGLLRHTVGACYETLACAVVERLFATEKEPVDGL